MTVRQGIAFFETQFQRQVAAGEFALNPFETACLPYVRGRVLDLGCGLGNLSVEAARRGHEVVAVDASATAIHRLHQVAQAERLPLTARRLDLADEGEPIPGLFDTIVAIGLLMFFPRGRALELLEQLQGHVRPGGRAVINILTEGTTYLAMFDPGGYCLFGTGELEARFDGWEILLSRQDRFDAPGGTLKAFATIVAQKENARHPAKDDGREE